MGWCGVSQGFPGDAPEAGEVEAARSRGRWMLSVSRAAAPFVYTITPATNKVCAP